MLFRSIPRGKRLVAIAIDANVGHQLNHYTAQAGRLLGWKVEPMWVDDTLEAQREALTGGDATVLHRAVAARDGIVRRMTADAAAVLTERGANADAVEESWFRWAETRETCPECQGTRLNPVARSVRLPLGEGEQGRPSVEDMGRWSVDEARAWLDRKSTRLNSSH